MDNSGSPASANLSSDPVPLDEVLKEERLAIRDRRRVALGDSETDLPEYDLVGLALSGGGLRSAMFNLGFLQALEKGGLMKFVDYLSTVSGGGYVGGFYSACGHHANLDRTAEASTTSRSRRGSRSRIPLFSEAAHRFINAGQYLNQPWSFLAAFLFPSMLVFLLFFSGAAALASLIALFIRWFDRPEVNDHLVLLGFKSEFGALCVAVLSLWCAFILINTGLAIFARDRRGSVKSLWSARCATYLKLFAIAVLCGVAILMGNYDFGLVSGGSIQFQKEAQLPLAILALLGLLALFRLPLLLRSEQTTASWWQKIALWCIMMLTVGGGSLAVLTYVGSEGISGYPQSRGPQLDNGDIVDDAAFVAWYQEDGFAVDKTSNEYQVFNKYHDLVEAVEQRKREIFPEDVEWQGNPSTLLRLQTTGRAVRYLFGWLEAKHPIYDLLKEEQELRRQRQLVVDSVNAYYFPDLLPEAAAQRSASAIPVPVETHTKFHRPTADLLQDFARRVQLFNANASVAADPGRIRENIAKYLDSVTNHGDRPLIGKASLLKTLIPMIDADGQLSYDDQLEPRKELLLRRQLLEATYPNVFKQLQFVSTLVVIDKDQQARWWIFLVSFCIFLFMARWVDFNAHAAVFRFYRERIAKTFIEAGCRNRADADMALSRFAPWDNGFPYPLISASLKLPQSVDINQLTPDELGDNPAKVDGSVGSDWYSFLLSPKFTGFMPVAPARAAGRKTYRPTYSYLNDELKVSDAITLSGAALTPWMAHNPALNLLMHVFNLRLEQWLPNPAADIALLGSRPMRLLRMATEAARCSTREGLKQWQWGVVADGGFREFLGVEELIARRCRIVIVSDAGCNNGLSEFGVLADLIRQLRLDHNVEILDLDHDLPLDVDRLKRTRDGKGTQHFIAGRIRYPMSSPRDDIYARSGLFVYVQMSLTGDENIDLAQFQKINPSFPDEPITNQFFTAHQVESLRQLGEHVGRHLCQRLDPDWVETNGDAGNDEKARREGRVERLADALLGAYLLECRQERVIDRDDTPPEMPLISGQIDPQAIAAFCEFEERGERGRRLAHFATCVVDGYSPDDPPLVDSTTISVRTKLAREIYPEDLAGLAVECNRRYVGFRSENPDRYFRIGGRRLLLRSTSRAIQVCRALHYSGESPHIETYEQWRTTSFPKLVHALARLAAHVQTGIFRRSGVETSRDLTLCALHWINEKNKHRFAKFPDMDPMLDRVSFRRGLQLAIQTGLACEVEAFLTDVLIQGKTPEISSRDRLSLGSLEPASAFVVGPKRPDLAAEAEPVRRSRNGDS